MVDNHSEHVLFVTVVLQINDTKLMKTGGPVRP